MKTKLLFILLFCFTGVFAQDTLYYKNGSKQIVKVTEVGLDDIKYSDFQNPNAPLFVIEKEQLVRIEFADGNSLKFSEDMLSLAPSAEGLKKTRAIKFEFLSPLNDVIMLDYEMMIKKRISLEFKLGAIGVGFDPSHENASGALFKAGVKFMNSPDYYIRGMKHSHPLRGGYVKPEILFSTFGVDEIDNSSMVQHNNRVNYTNFAINIVFGKQRILSETLTTDWYIGIGYGGQWNNKTASSNLYADETTNFRPRAYSHSYLGEDFPMVISAGFSLGFLIK